MLNAIIDEFFRDYLGDPTRFIFFIPYRVKWTPPLVWVIYNQMQD